MNILKRLAGWLGLRKECKMNPTSQLKKLPFIKPGTILFEEYVPGVYTVELPKGNYVAEIAGSSGATGSSNGSYSWDNAGHGELKHHNFSVQRNTLMTVYVAGWTSGRTYYQGATGYIGGFNGVVDGSVRGGGGGGTSAVMNEIIGITLTADGGGGGGSYDSLYSFIRGNSNGGAGSGGRVPFNGGVNQQNGTAGNGLGGRATGQRQRVGNPGWVKITRA